MKIKFFCDNHCADFEKDEIELIYQNQIFKFCSFCGEKLKILNLDEVITQDLQEKIKNNINKWFNQIGIDNTLDLIQRNRNASCSRLYIEELQKRGFNIK